MGVSLGWKVATPTWAAFTRHLDDRFGDPVLDDDGDPVRDDSGEVVRKAPKGTYSRRLETALDQYIQTDGPGDRGEAILRDLADRLGVNPASDTQNWPDPTDQPTEYPGVRINPVLKDEVRAFADRHDMGYGEVATRAMREYLAGGRAARMGRLAEALDDDLRDAVGRLDDVDQEADDAPTHKERQTRKAAIALTDGAGVDGYVTTTEIHDAIRQELGTTDHYLETYTPLILDRLDLTRHPLAGEPKYVTVDSALRIADDVGIPEQIARPPRDLDRMDLQWRVIYAAARPLAVHGGRWTSVDFDEILEQYLDPATFDEADVVDVVDTIDTWDGVTVDGAGRAATVNIDLQELAKSSPADYNVIATYAESPADPLPADETADVEEGITARLDDFGTPDAPSDTADPVASDGGQEGPQDDADDTPADDVAAETAQASDAVDAELDAILGGDTVDPDDDPLADQADDETDLRASDQEVLDDLQDEYGGGAQ